MIYFIQDTVNKFIKIGKTNDGLLSNRMSSLQSSNPNELRCLAIIEHEVDDKLYHERFEHCRHRREWFRPEADLLDFIQSLPSVDMQRHLDTKFVRYQSFSFIDYWAMRR